MQPRYNAAAVLDVRPGQFVITSSGRIGMYDGPVKMEKHKGYVRHGSAGPTYVHQIHTLRFATSQEIVDAGLSEVNFVSSPAASVKRVQAIACHVK